VDLSPALPLDQRGKPRKDPAKASKTEGKKPKKSPEADLEAATTLGDTAYWLTSHGLNSKGKRKDARFIFFATTLPRPDGPAMMVGQPYRWLHDDLLQSPALAPFDLRAASERAPKEEGALNLEGLTATPDGKSLYIGFRNPVPRGKALLVPLLNPADVMRGQRARLGQPRQLDLGGQGIRALSWWRGHYLIIAGDHGDGGISHLYRWDGRGEARRIDGVDLEGLNPEAFFTPESRDEIVLFSDDGGVNIDGRRCKDLEDDRQRQFRGLRLRP
jgi:hypothetical protein